MVKVPQSASEALPIRVIDFTSVMPSAMVKPMCEQMFLNDMLFPETFPAITAVPSATVPAAAACSAESVAVIALLS